MKFLPILSALILLIVGSCNGSNCDNDYASVLLATQSIGALLTEAPMGIPTIMNSINFVLGQSGGSCMTKETGYRIQQQSAKDRAGRAILFLRGIVQSIRDSTGCKNIHTPERCIESMKNSYTNWESLRNRMKVDHYIHFDTAFQDGNFDDPALYEPFVLYGQIELMLNTILYDLCGRNETSSVPHCNRHKMRENKNNFKSAFKFFLRIGTDLYGYRTMNRFNDDKGGEVARKMKLTGDKILRPMILKWIDRLKDPKFRSIMDIGGNEKTWRTNPEKYLEGKQFWADNFDISYPYRRASKGASSFPPVPIRSSDWIFLRCSYVKYESVSCPVYSVGWTWANPGGTCTKTHTLGGRDSWLSCWGDTKGRSFGEYCKFRSCPGTMAGNPYSNMHNKCHGELFQIQSIYVHKTPIKSGQKVGLKYESNYWLSRYQGSVLDGYGMNMPCPNKIFTRSDITSCIYETWSISKTNGKNNEVIRHGDLVDIPGLAQCFIFKKM